MKRHHGRTTKTPNRGKGHPRPPLGPITSQLTRVKLLCLSYPDAAEGVRLELIGHHASRAAGSLGRNGKMWPFGSYPRLEDQFEELRAYCQEVEAHRLWYRRFWQVYVQDAYDHREIHYSPRFMAEAHAGLRRIAAGMGTKVYVPIEVSEANGFNPDDAQAFTRRALDQAA